MATRIQSFFTLLLIRKEEESYFEDGRVLNNAEDIHVAAAEYFRDFLTEPNEVERCDLSDIIESVISEEENEMLCNEPSENEIRDAVFSIPKYSIPGPDGFGSDFFMACWDLVKDDVVEAAREFFTGSPLSRFYSSSFIVLIPKVPDPPSFDKFHPINLCSVAYKIFAKILVNRLTRVIHKLVSQEQGAFVPGRSIFENISLAREML